jgi:hypothetical protein
MRREKESDRVLVPMGFRVDGIVKFSSGGFAWRSGIVELMVWSLELMGYTSTNELCFYDHRVTHLSRHDSQNWHC